MSIIGLPDGHTNPLWFVFCLFIIKVADTFLSRLKNRTWIIVVEIAVVSFALLLTDGVIPLKRPLIWFIVAAPFYWVGKILKKRDSLFRIESVTGRAILVVVSIMLPFVFSCINGRVDLFFCMFGQSGVLYYIFGIVTSVVMLIAFENLVDIKKEVITTLSKGTILIVAFHRFLLWPMEIFNLNDILLIRVLYPLLVVLAFYYPILFCLKYTPIILGNRK